MIQLLFMLFFVGFVNAAILETKKTRPIQFVEKVLVTLVSIFVVYVLYESHPFAFSDLTRAHNYLQGVIAVLEFFTKLVEILVIGSLTTWMLELIFPKRLAKAIATAIGIIKKLFGVHHHHE